MRGALALVLLLSAAAGLRAAPSRASDAASAARMEKELAVIDEALEGEEYQTILETLPYAGVAATLEAYAPGSPRSEAANKAAQTPWAKLKKKTAALELRQALLADELHRYKETGVLSPTPPETVAGIKRLLDHEWTSPPSVSEVPKLEMDLAELQKQLGAYEALAPRPAAAVRVKAPRPARTPEARPLLKLFAPAPLPLAPRPLFMPDAGVGRPKIDPLPDLIVLLSSAEARGRALAADELGNLGAKASAAAPALREKLSDPDRRVRASAAQALGAIGAADPAIRAGLEAALLDSNEEVRLNARAALQRLLPAPPQRTLPVPVAP